MSVLPALIAWLLFSHRSLKLKSSKQNYKVCTSLYEEKYMLGTKFQWHILFLLFWLCKISYNYENLWDLPVEHFNVSVHEFFAMKPNIQRPQLTAIHRNNILTSSIILLFVLQYAVRVYHITQLILGNQQKNHLWKINNFWKKSSDKISLKAMC